MENKELENGNGNGNGNENENEKQDGYLIADAIDGTTELVEYEGGNMLTASSFLIDIKIELFSDYLYSYKKGKDTIVGIDSDGVRHIASDLGVGIDSCEYTETEDYYEVKATAISRDGRRYFAVRRQQKIIKTRDGKEFEDRDALAKAFTAAQRNALRGLVPDKMIKNLIIKGVEYQKRCDSDIEYVKNYIKEFHNKNKSQFDKRAIRLTDVFNEARIRKHSKDWDLNDWLELRNDIRNYKTNWIWDMGTDPEPGSFDGGDENGNSKA